MSPGYYDKVAQDVQQKLGIPAQNFWWTVTRTHSAQKLDLQAFPRYSCLTDTSKPLAGGSNPEYSQFFEDKLIEGLRLAKDGLEPARLGVGLRLLDCEYEPAGN